MDHTMQPLEEEHKYIITQKHLLIEAQKWVEKVYGNVNEVGDKDTYYTRLGMLVDFITEIAPK